MASLLMRDGSRFWSLCSVFVELLFVFHIIVIKRAGFRYFIVCFLLHVLNSL